MDLIPKRDYFFCRYCGTYHFLHENEDGVKLTGIKDVAKCPECDENLHLGIISKEPILHCEKCRGNLVKTKSVNIILKDNAIRKLALPSNKQLALDHGDRPKQHKCPGCHQAMDSHPFHGTGNIYVESCGKCLLVWFDYKEILLLG